MNSKGETKEEHRHFITVTTFYIIIARQVHLTLHIGNHIHVSVVKVGTLKS